MTTRIEREQPRRAALASTVLVAALFAIGGCSVFPQNRHTDLDGPSLTDEQARAQVVEPAKRIVRAMDFQHLAAGFRFGSCTDQGIPPYRGLVSIGFAFPPGADENAYVEQIAATMVADGWVDGAPPGKKPYGRVIHHGDVMAIIAPNPDYPGDGSLKIYGECRNMVDHRKDGGTIGKSITQELTE